MLPPCKTLPCVLERLTEKSNGSTTISVYATCFVCVPAVPTILTAYVPSTADTGAVNVICCWQFGVHACPPGYPMFTPLVSSPVTLTADSPRTATPEETLGVTLNVNPCVTESVNGSE